jgi:AcrB/AcrD/AcrF family
MIRFLPPFAALCPTLLLMPSPGAAQSGPDAPSVTAAKPIPLVIATGPGAEMRQVLGTAVFAGMLGVTFFGLFLTPAFYVAIRWLVLNMGRRRRQRRLNLRVFRWDRREP